MKQWVVVVESIVKAVFFVAIITCTHYYGICYTRRRPVKHRIQVLKRRTLALLHLPIPRLCRLHQNLVVNLEKKGELNHTKYLLMPFRIYLQYLIPSAEPGSVIPRINKIKSTAYGNNAVNQTTCQTIQIWALIQERLFEKDIVTFPDVLIPFHNEK